VRLAQEHLPELEVRSERYLQRPHSVLADLRSHGPIARSHRGLEVLSYDLVQRVLATEEMETAGSSHFRDHGAPQVLIDFVSDGLLLNMPRERHDPVRRIVSRAFGMREIKQQRPMIDETLAEVLAPLFARGEFDVVEDFTRLYPMLVLCRYLGVPVDDLPRFAESAVQLELMGSSPLKPAFPMLELALNSLRDYIVELVSRRRAEPREDFISALVHAQDEDGTITETEVVWSIVNLLFAGQDTTRYQLASTIQGLLESNVWAKLATSPELIPSAMEEALRYRPVVQFLLRIPRCTVTVGNYEFPAGQRVVLNMLAASRDANTFSEPDRFDLHRDSRYSLLFGHGMHYCVGRQLARLEMELALERLIATIPNAQISSTVSSTGWQSMLGGPRNLRLAF
jgi:cytochrome P450